MATFLSKKEKICVLSKKKKNCGCIFLLYYCFYLIKFHITVATKKILKVVGHLIEAWSTYTEATLPPSDETLIQLVGTKWFISMVTMF